MAKDVPAEKVMTDELKPLTTGAKVGRVVRNSAIGVAESSHLLGTLGAVVGGVVGAATSVCLLLECRSPIKRARVARTILFLSTRSDAPLESIALYRAESVAGSFDLRARALALPEKNLDFVAIKMRGPQGGRQRRPSRLQVD